MERPMNTAQRDRVFHKAIEEFIRGTEKRRTPVTRVKLAKGKDNEITVTLYTSRPNILRLEATDIASDLKELIGPDRTVNVQVLAESRAVAKFVRTSPRKARLVLDAIKGKRVSEALALLRFIPKHACEPISKVLKSAAANALDGWQAVPEELKIANFIADGGPILKRVRPRAQGRAYRILKRTSHLTVILTEIPPPAPKRRAPAKPKAKKTQTAQAAPKAKAAAKAPGAASKAEATKPKVEQAEKAVALETPETVAAVVVTPAVESEAPAADAVVTVEVKTPEAAVEPETPATEAVVTTEDESAADAETESKQE
jgi:large subunit ribosomal protein L22